MNSTVAAVARPAGQWRKGPRKLKPDIRRLIVDLAGHGLGITAIASVVGCHRDTIYEWRKSDPALGVAMDRARGQLVARLAKSAIAKAETDGRLALQLLERVNAPDFCPRVVADRAVGATKPAAGQVSVECILMLQRARAERDGIDFDAVMQRAGSIAAHFDCPPFPESDHVETEISLLPATET